MIYRQRLNTIGKIGAAISIGAPLISIILMWNIFEGSPYGRSSMTPVFLLSGLLPVGWALLFIGREYYDAADEIAAEKANPGGGSVPYEQTRDDFMALPKRLQSESLGQDKNS